MADIYWRWRRTYGKSYRRQQLVRQAGVLSGTPRALTTTLHRSKGVVAWGRDAALERQTLPAALSTWA